mgnify:FL=1
MVDSKNSGREKSAIEKRPRGAIKDFIWVKENSLSEDFCKHVIEKFDNDSRKRDGIIGKEDARVDKSIKDTKDLNISFCDDWKEEDTTLFNALAEGLDGYNEYLCEINEGIAGTPNPKLWQNDTGYKVQKYEPGGSYHWHHDWSMTGGYQSGVLTKDPVASRIFTFMWYLNTIEKKDDGYTEFADGTRIQPECGKIMIFPATWTYLHRGYPPRVKKYVCNGWIHARPMIHQELPAPNETDPPIIE